MKIDITTEEANEIRQILAEDLGRTACRTDKDANKYKKFSENRWKLINKFAISESSEVKV